MIIFPKKYLLPCLTFASFLVGISSGWTETPAETPFAIQVIDQETKRGIPLVKLTTTNAVVYYTDSAGYVAFDEPGLLGEEVYFSIESPGYTMPADGFGNVGKKFDTKVNGKVTVSLKRTQLAERMYQITGQGIYHHSTRLGMKAPIESPNVNGLVMGQDTVMPIQHAGKIYWFWGDTSRPSYPLGHFGTAMATSELPTKLDASQGINFKYLVDDNGFSRPVFQLKESGVVWLHGVTELKNPQGKLQIVGHYSRLKGLGNLLEHGIAAFNDDTQQMEIVSKFPLDAPLHPFGQTLKHADDNTDNNSEYVYFCTPYANTRVKATWEAFCNSESYESFTPLKQGVKKLDLQHPQLERDRLERDESGKIVYAWKANTAYLNALQQSKLIESNKLSAEETFLKTTDIKTGKRIALHTGSVRWNKFRKAFIMIAVRYGAEESLLGEVYYLESKELNGSWPHAMKVATHPKYTFYNPVQHAFLDQQAGRIIYFEGTYTHQFSATKTRTPRYDYNQLMYRMDLDDKRVRVAFESE